jgi:hypothetical protein
LNKQIDSKLQRVKLKFQVRCSVLQEPLC